MGDHRSTIYATISDKKIAVDANSDGIIDYYSADVITANDYYPGGMMMTGRDFTITGKRSRHSINGQERSDELNDNLTTALYWEYDSRIVRRWNLDPVPQIGQSDYACFNNNPINLSDEYGDDPGKPGKKSKGYDWSSALRYQCIHFNAAKVAFNIYRARQHFGHYSTKYNNAYKAQISSRAAKDFQELNMVVTGIDAAAFAKEIKGYYETFEKAFNLGRDYTMKELSFIFNNKFEKAKDIFKSNLNVNQYYDALHQSDALIDDLRGTAYTIGHNQEEFIKRAALWFEFAFPLMGANLASIGVENPYGLVKLSLPSRTFPQMSGVSGKGFNSFSAFKRSMGPAGPNQAWHHIVEQTDGNIASFGNKSIHNTNNLIKLPHGAGSIHARISGFYSSIQPTVTGSSTMTVRQWLSTKDYQFQYKFGIQKLKDFGWVF